MFPCFQNVYKKKFRWPQFGDDGFVVSLHNFKSLKKNFSEMTFSQKNCCFSILVLIRKMGSSSVAVAFIRSRRFH